MSAVTEGLSTTKTKRFKVKHPKRKLYRSSEPLLSVFMWGINHTVRELTHVSLPGNVQDLIQIQIRKCFTQQHLYSQCSGRFKGRMSRITSSSILFLGAVTPNEF